jgi:hypothetical protein
MAMNQPIGGGVKGFAFSIWGQDGSLAVLDEIEESGRVVI